MNNQQKQVSAKCTGYDEIYTLFFTCDCGCKTVTASAKFCHQCGGEFDDSINIDERGERIDED